MFETFSDTTPTAVPLKLILFCILCVKYNLKQSSLCWKKRIFPKSKSEEKVKYTCTSALVLRPTSYGKSGGEPVYLHFCSGQCCWVLTSSLPASLFHLSHQLLQMHRGQRQVWTITVKNKWEIKLTQQDLMPKIMEPLISNWFKRMWTWGKEEPMWTWIVDDIVHLYIIVNSVVQGPQEVDQISQ